MKLLRPTYVEIDLDIIKHNINEIKKIIDKNTKLGLVLKSNAYGHGAVEIAKVLEDEDIDYICVAGLNEAMELRNNNISLPILVMGYTPDDCLDIAIENNITLTVLSNEQAKLLSNIATKLSKKANMHLKVDTGFNRLGFKIDEKLPCMIEEIYNLENINIEGIFSHLALKDRESDYEQFNKFNNLLEKIKHLDIPIKHICDSIGMTAYRDFHMDMVRVGASLYGYNSRESVMDLKPAMTFKSKFAQIKNIKKGEGISYDYSYIADKDMKIGTVLCGYSDGIPRILSNKGYVYVNGKKANILGKICMDQCIVDLTDIEDASMDSEVIFYGNGGPNLIDIANLAHTNKNELLSIVSRRVARVYIKDKKIYKVLDYLS
ncbi:alanine racemase [Romboutsia sp. 13368]|uniref:alanine racemase n=1 Tax=Romboutsia sp. 13368 TaxID=2708053 RepID=UPI0025E67857|nr:alanine racemase [Romboutsia sp. 13368]